MAQAGADFGFVGQAYEASDPYQDRQRTINFYPEVSGDRSSKEVVALLGCPGLSQVLTLGAATAPVRGAWVLPGGTQCLFVCGNGAYLATATVPATQTSIAQFSVAYLGALNTATGTVCIRDNGAYDTNTGLRGYVCVVDGPYGYLYNVRTGVWSQITDPAFLGADRVEYIDGWLIFNQPGTDVFYTTASTPDTVTFNASFFAHKDSSSDALVTLYAQNRELWLIGERTTEVWYDAGGQNFAFARIPGVAPQIGCAAKHSIARMGNSLVWLGKNERGQNVVVATKGYDYEEISTRAIEHQISQYPLVSDAIGYVYQEEGHSFYVLTFPTADATWVYDAATRMWHQRGWWDAPNGTYHRHRSNCFVNFQNLRMVGDYATNAVHIMSRAYYTDAGTPLRAQRRTPHVWSRTDRKRVFMGQLQIEFAPGVGAQTGQGVNPQAMLRWSNDGGTTWGSEHWTSVGALGQYRNRAIWRRLGYARDRVYELNYSEPTLRDIVGATLYGEGEDDSEAA